MKTLFIASLSVASLVAAGCASTGMSPVVTPVFSQVSLPENVKVPAGHKVALETIGKGTIVYECRAIATTVGAFEWVFVAPDALLTNRAGQRLGKYYGPPATWEGDDGSKVSGAQLAVSAASPGNIPLQLVKANPSSGRGVMTDTTFIQSVATVGGQVKARL